MILASQPIEIHMPIEAGNFIRYRPFGAQRCFKYLMVIGDYCSAPVTDTLHLVDVSGMHSLGAVQSTGATFREFFPNVSLEGLLNEYQDLRIVSAEFVDRSRILEHIPLGPQHLLPE